MPLKTSVQLRNSYNKVASRTHALPPSCPDDGIGLSRDYGLYMVKVLQIRRVIDIVRQVVVVRRANRVEVGHDEPIKVVSTCNSVNLRYSCVRAFLRRSTGVEPNNNNFARATSAESEAPRIFVIV